MATEYGLLDGDSPDDPISSKYGVVDVLEAGEKALKSATLESFNKKARNLAGGILTTDDENADGLPDGGESTELVFPSDMFEATGGDDGCDEGLVFMDEMFETSDDDDEDDKKEEEDDNNNKDNDNNEDEDNMDNGNDSEDDGMVDSDTFIDE